MYYREIYGKPANRTLYELWGLLLDTVATPSSEWAAKTIDMGKKYPPPLLEFSSVRVLPNIRVRSVRPFGLFPATEK